MQSLTTSGLLMCCCWIWTWMEDAGPSTPPRPFTLSLTPPLLLFLFFSIRHRSFLFMTIFVMKSEIKINYKVQLRYYFYGSFLNKRRKRASRSRLTTMATIRRRSESGLRRCCYEKLRWDEVECWRGVDGGRGIDVFWVLRWHIGEAGPGRRIRSSWSSRWNFCIVSARCGGFLCVVVKWFGNPDVWIFSVSISGFSKRNCNRLLSEKWRRKTWWRPKRLHSPPSRLLL